MPKNNTALYFVGGCTGAFVLALGMLAFMVLVSKYGATDAGASTARVEHVAPLPHGEAANQVRGKIRAIGEPVEIDGIAYTVHGVRWTNILDALVPHPQLGEHPIRETLDLGSSSSMWALVDLSIRNTSNADFIRLEKPHMVAPGGMISRCSEAVIGKGVADLTLSVPRGQSLRVLIIYKLISNCAWRLVLDGGFDSTGRELIEIKGMGNPTHEPKIRVDGSRE